MKRRRIPFCVKVDNELSKREEGYPCSDEEIYKYYSVYLPTCVWTRYGYTVSIVVRGLECINKLKRERMTEVSELLERMREEFDKRLEKIVEQVGRLN